MTSGVKRSVEEIEDYKAKILEYLESTPGGSFYGACAKLKVGYSTAFIWRNEDPEWAKQIDAARTLADEVGGDFAEGKLMSCIQDGDFQAIKYYLSTRHKKRGYTERQEVGHGFAADVTDTDKDIIARALALMSSKGNA